jgi:hypothetical protein
MQPAEIDEASNHLEDLPSNQPTLKAPVSSSETCNAPLEFVFKPDISALIDPNAPELLEGTDAWALNRGFATVSPLYAAFKPAPRPKVDPTNPSIANRDPAWKI